jgi:hypothetical protein
MKVEAMFLLQEWDLLHLLWRLFLPYLYQDLYRIPQILLYTQQYQEQCLMVHHHHHQLQFLAVMLTSHHMDRVMLLGIIQ